MKKNRKKKKHLKVKALLILIGLILVIALSGIVFFNLPIKTIYIKGNNLVSDYDILVASNLKNETKLFKYSCYNLENKIESLPQIMQAQVKKSLGGKIVIEVKEAKVLFFNRNTNLYVLENNKTITDKSFDCATLINYVPDTIYKRLIESLNYLTDNTLGLISEIEYSPSKSGDTIIDDTRFLMRMRDGNNVYINLINIERLNMYLEISTIFETKGTLGLDSDNGQVVFNAF